MSLMCRKGAKYEEVKDIILGLSSVNLSNINVTGETKIFDELGISSINFVVMIAEIEDKFNITINLEDVDVLKLNQIKSIVELVEKTLEIEKAED